MQFIPGQRWISDTEPELGVGTVLAAEGNRVTLLFIAAEERRTYAQANSPLTRVRFAVGDTVESVDGWSLRVVSIAENNGLLTYHGKDEQGTQRVLEELDISHFLQFNKPQDRLFTGQIDDAKLYCLRYNTLLQQGRLDRSLVRGLVGPRTSLIAHQLYIAHEVATRHAPRVLLADEVGLGKTIEAGMILHHQLLTGRIARVLVIVPEPLLHQWLVEMLRRFSLRFSLIDEDAWDEEADANPFLEHDLVLCALEAFMHEPQRQQQALLAGWDTLVVDEAHHLQWTETQASPEYEFVERLAQAIPSVLLLTATPEQLGKVAHFARLRLLDADRFYRFEQFLQEEKAYEPLAHLIDHLLGQQPLPAEILQQLREVAAQDKADELLSQLNDAEAGQTARESLLRLLLDRHGTGRLLFRNTRATVQGFPQRQLFAYPVPCPPAYEAAQAKPGEARLHPETAVGLIDGEAWWMRDPRVARLLEILQGLKGEKALVICAADQTALDLEEALRVRTGINAVVFHAGMSIIARDRAAAWFSDTEQGAQVLVCSEIGSEGRNFQFAHHMVLFDLPYNPDVLEQRIGRLDRIGQRETIRIHAVYLENTAQDVLFQWYRDGLDAFSHPCPAGVAVLQQLKPRLDEQLQATTPDGLTALLAQARQANAAILRELHEGRDRLLELNSCRPKEAQALVEAIDAFEQEHDVWDYLEQVFDGYGVNVEEHSDDCYILTPGENMLIPHFPELLDDGITVTLSRAKALAREDMLFLTWEHPMVSGAADLILTSGHGNATVSLQYHPNLTDGQLLLEAVFLMECAAPKALQIGRFLPQTLVRTLIDGELRDLAGKVPFESLRDAGQPIDRVHAADLVRSQQKLLTRMLQTAEQMAQKQAPTLIAQASKQMLESLGAELRRLNVLKKVNPAVRAEEIEHIRQTMIDCHGYIQAAKLRLDAVRVILTV